jgi:hypothetical protein
MDGRSNSARELIIAVFRLAIADYLGLSYSDDGCPKAFLQGDSSEGLCEVAPSVFSI